MADERKRVFATLVYLDSAPSDWRTTLSELCVPCFISPLHDQDINPDGSQKKPHYHVMLMFDGKKSDKQIKEIWSLIGGVGEEIILSTRGYARYLCHLDNPEKAQYDPDQVVMYGGADYFGIIGLPIDKYKAIGEMMDFCADNDVYSYAQLLTWCRNNRFDWFRILCDSGTYVIKEYLKSRTWQYNNQSQEENRNDC